MPRPTSGTTVNRPDLGQLAYEYLLAASQRGFIGTRILPLFPVTEQSAQYPVIPIESLLKMPETRRGARGAYNRGDWLFEMENYSCEEHGWEEPLDDSEVRLYQRFFDAEEIATMRAMDVILRSQEKRIADKVMDDTTLNDNDVTNEWDDPANATPRDDVKDGAKTMHDNTGVWPNVLVISKTVFDNLVVCEQVTNNIKYTTPILYESLAVQRRLLAQFFDLDDILIGDAVYDSADKGQTASINSIWGTEHGLLARIATRGQDLREPCIGRTFLWQTDSPSNVLVEQYREEQIRSSIYRARQYTDEAFVFTGAGFLLGNLTS